MNVLVLYDSNFGNTKKIAESIAQELNANAISVENAKGKNLNTYDLIVIGSPINGWQPTQRMNNFLDHLQKSSLQGIKVTTFDTRVNIFFHGDAAKKMAKKLKKVGAEVIIEPEAFYVEGTEGPLLKDEVKKAKKWAGAIKKAYGLSQSFAHPS